MPPKSSVPRPTARVAKALRSKEAAKAACNTCRTKKVRCSGTAPCTYCSKRGLDCEISEQGQRRLYSISEVKRLRDRLAHYENYQSPLQTPDVDRSLAFPVTTNNVNGDSPIELRSPAQIFNDSAQLSPESIIQPEPCLSSNNIFGSRIQSLLQSSGSKHEGTNENTQGPDAFNPHILSTLTEPESRRLLAVVVFYIGQTQHHFDIREFSDRLGLYFADPQHVRWQNEPWLLEMMLVLAVGKLFAGDFDEGCDTPGSKLFDGAHKSIPALSQLITHGVLGVEILALAAVYLQNLHRKDEAYFYISTALRLAILLGLHRKSGLEGRLESEKVHINRLWWTIYMQERRLAAVTGNPISICDEAIELGMPTDCLGFPTASALRTNLKISKVLSRIITVIYGPRRLAEDTFVPSVRDIVKFIFEIAQDIPLKGIASFGQIASDPSGRSEAYLHLMLYQAVILTTRPIMLHLAKQIVSGEEVNSAPLRSSPLGRLSRSCSEAARRLLDVVIALRKKDMLIIFGFFDFDACFSAAFVMILSAIVDSVDRSRCKQTPPPGLRDALDILEFLSDRGNYLAKRGLLEVRQTWDCFSAYLERRHDTQTQPRVFDGAVSPSEEQSHNTADDATSHVLPASTTNTNVGDGHGPNSGDHTLSGNDALTSGSSELAEALLLDTNLLDDFAQIWNGITEDQSFTSSPNNDGRDPTEAPPYYLYPLYNSLDLDLVGGDIDSFAGLRQSMSNM